MQFSTKHVILGGKLSAGFRFIWGMNALEAPVWSIAQKKNLLFLHICVKSESGSANYNHQLFIS